MTEEIMTQEQSDQLRAPFAPEFIGKLPKLTCSACTKSPTKECPQHKKSKCNVCNAYISAAHIHLDFVGHADITNRLLLVDPTWYWEPAALDQLGQPLISKSADGMLIMWGKLTVCGVTRWGVGSIEDDPKKKDVCKQLIGDMIRNAAMRFGVSLDLWSKNDRLEIEPNGVSEFTRETNVQSQPPQSQPPQAPQTAQESPQAQTQRRTAPQATQKTSPPSEAKPEANGDPNLASAAQLSKIGVMIKKHFGDDAEARHGFVESIVKRQLSSAKEMTKKEASEVISALIKLEAEQNA